MNVQPSAAPGIEASHRGGCRQNASLSVVAGFTWTELIVSTLLAIALFEFIHC